MKKSEKLERLFILYEQSMYRAAYSILNSAEQSEDAVSQAFIKLAQNIDKIDEPDSEKTRRYVKKIIKNTSIDFYRKNKRESERTEVSAEKYEGVSDKRAEQDFRNIEEDESFKNILNGLSERYKEIFMMRCMQDMSFAEIAAVVEEKPATVRKQYERAKKIIRENMEEGNYYGYKEKAL